MTWRSLVFGCPRCLFQPWGRVKPLLLQLLLWVSVLTGPLTGLGAQVLPWDRADLDSSSTPNLAEQHGVLQPVGKAIFLQEKVICLTCHRPGGDFQMKTQKCLTALGLNPYLPSLHFLLLA